MVPRNGQILVDFHLGKQSYV